MAAVGSLRTPALGARLMHILALRAGAAAVRRGLLARGGSALRTKALSVSITAGKPCSRPLASLLLQPCFMEPQRERPATRSTVDSSTLRGWEELTGLPAERGNEPGGTTSLIHADSLTTDDDINVFEAKALAAGRYGGVLTLMRRGYGYYVREWARTHHLGVVEDHSSGRKRALVLPAFHRRVMAVYKMLSRGERLTHPLDKATGKWMGLVCISSMSLVLKAPFDELATSFDYGPCADWEKMHICAPAALLYRTQQLLSCRGLLPPHIQEAAACLFAENSLSQRQFVGMGNPTAPGIDSELRDANFEAKDQWAVVFAEGLATGFQGVFVVGMLGPHYRVWARKHSLPDAVVVDVRTLCAGDFSLLADAPRSEAFRKIFDACLEHGVLGPGDEVSLATALYNLGRGSTDLIEALEVLNVVPLGNGVFRMRGNPRAAEKAKSWPADLPVAVELRGALAPLMRVDALLEACKFVPVADSAQIKSRHRHHRRDTLVDLCTGTEGGAGQGRRNQPRQAGLRAGDLAQQGGDGPADAGQRPGARPPLLQPLWHAPVAGQAGQQGLRVQRVLYVQY